MQCVFAQGNLEATRSAIDCAHGAFPGSGREGDDSGPHGKGVVTPQWTTARLVAVREGSALAVHLQRSQRHATTLGGGWDAVCRARFMRVDDSGAATAALR